MQGKRQVVAAVPWLPSASWRGAGSWLARMPYNSVRARVWAIVMLCALTGALHLSDLRYETARSSLVPGIFAANWFASGPGIGVMSQDPSVAVLARTSNQPVPVLVRDVAGFQGHDGVRIGIEAQANGVAAGSQFWQAARVLVYSFDREGRRLTHLPHEVLQLDGSTDWTSAQLVVPIVPEIAAMRVIIAQAGERGALMVRNLRVDAVTQTTLYGSLRTILIGLWFASGIWVLFPIVAGGLTRMSRLVVTGFGVAVLVGAFTPQPLLSDTIRKALAVMEAVVVPVQAAAEARPAGARLNATAAALAPVPGLDRSPRLGNDDCHILGFLLLAAALPFGFRRVPRLQLFAYLMLLGISIEMVQGFTLTRSAEFSDVVRDLIGSAAGLAWFFAWERRHSFRLPGRLERAGAP